MCNCIDGINKQLWEQKKKEGAVSAELDMVYGAKGEVYPLIQYTYKYLTKTGKERSHKGIVIPQYCPFCGKRY